MIKINAGTEFNKNAEHNGEAIAEMAGSSLKAQVDTAMGQARKAGIAVRAFAKEKPWQLAGLALTVGLLAGWIFKKKD